MKNTLPGELFNQVGVPTHGQTPVLVSEYIQEMAYKLPSVTDVMMAKEYWHTVCDFAERSGALREHVSGDISASNLDLVVTAPTYGQFQRFVGAAINGVPVGFEKFSTKDTENGPALTFVGSVITVEGSTVAASADISVVPDVTAVPSDQKAPRWFLQRYEKVLIHGARARLQAMTGRAWFDEAGARMHATSYMREINRVTHGLITSGMRREILIGMESVIARQSSTTSQTTNTSTVG